MALRRRTLPAANASGQRPSPGKIVAGAALAALADSLAGNKLDACPSVTRSVRPGNTPRLALQPS